MFSLDQTIINELLKHLNNVLQKPFQTLKLKSNFVIDSSTSNKQNFQSPKSQFRFYFPIVKSLSIPLIESDRCGVKHHRIYFLKKCSSNLEQLIKISPIKSITNDADLTNESR